MGLTHGDIFFNEKLLLNSVDLRIKLGHANNAFHLMLAWMRITLKNTGGLSVCEKLSISPTEYISHEAVLRRGIALLQCLHRCKKPVALQFYPQ